ncbi:MAG: TIGR03435 family protein [Vicinamibacterales bacterium]
MTKHIGFRLNVARSVILVGAAIATLAQARAQQPAAARPQFEVASVKPCGDDLPAGGRGGGGSFAPGRMTLNCQVVKGLIQAAYLLHVDSAVAHPELVLSTPIEGGPAWITSERYTINAKADEGTSIGMMQGPMMQALLEDRFTLQIHRETREVPVFALTVAKGGPKLTPFQEGSCVPVVMTFPPTPQRALAPGENRCARLGTLRGPNMVVDAQGITIEELSKSFLFIASGRRVIDKTGLTGKFVIHLEYAPEDPLVKQIAESQGAGDPTAPSIFTAIQEQLGLKLEPAKGPGEFLVIDHVERPTEN